MDENSIPVVVESDVKDKAYSMGYNRFEGIDVSPGEEISVAPFTDSAAYANHVLPTLRSMAGFGDDGMGTYQVEREIIVVSEPDDSPMMGEKTESHYLFNELVDCWHNGAYDAMEDAKSK